MLPQGRLQQRLPEPRIRRGLLHQRTGAQRVAVHHQRTLTLLQEDHPQLPALQAPQLLAPGVLGPLPLHKGLALQLAAARGEAR